MTQPAKVQEPSMEEILASIRRIIADDESKPATPAAAEPPSRLEPARAAPSTAKPAVMAGIPPSEIQPTRPSAVKPAIPVPAATNSQDDIDAMLAGLDAETSEAEVRPSRMDDVFDLTEQMAMPELPQPFHKVEPEDDIEFTETPAPHDRHRAAFDSQPIDRSASAEMTAAPAQQMLSQTTVSAVESAFNSLANTVLSNNARTLEDLVKEMLRPMLKSWLDDNLPGLVERIVRAEIERVSRGR